jgi:hypothetical protein
MIVFCEETAQEARMQALYIAHKEDGMPWIYVPELQVFFTAFDKDRMTPLIISYYAQLITGVNTKEMIEHYVHDHYDVITKLEIADRIVKFICERDQRRREINFYGYELTRDPRLALLPDQRAKLVEARREEFREWLKQSGEDEIGLEIEKLIIAPRGLH